MDRLPNEVHRKKPDEEPIRPSGWPEGKNEHGGWVQIEGQLCYVLNFLTAGQFLGVSPRQVRRWVKSGRLSLFGPGLVRVRDLIKLRKGLP